MVKRCLMGGVPGAVHIGGRALEVPSQRAVRPSLSLSSCFSLFVCFVFLSLSSQSV